MEKIRKPIIWLTGQPGSGKSTLAAVLVEKLAAENPITIDGDEIRILYGNQNYTPEGRHENIRNAQRIARFIQHKDLLAIASLVSPFKEVRAELKSVTTVLEVYLYATEERGREKYFALDYEKPSEDYLELNTSSKTVEECANEICDVYRKMAALSQGS